jgi:two-component system phosphate regulon sensor histidine kinase PhoR
MFRHLHWRIAVPYVALILVATLGLTFYVSDQVRQVRLADLEAQLLSDARLLGDRVAPLLLEEAGSKVLDELARRVAAPLDARVTIIGADGIVVGESHEDRIRMDNHLNRPEVQLALEFGQGSSMRYSATLGYEMMYAAVPIQVGEGPVLGVVRVALPLGEIEANVGHLRQNVLLAGLAMALTAALMAVLIARRSTRPIRQLTKVAERMAAGDLDARQFQSTRDEVGQLTRAFNHMAGQIREQVTTLAEERGRLAAVLAHMADGVLITDGFGQVELINAAAERLLDTSEAAALGVTFARVAPYHLLIEMWKACQEDGEEQIDTVEVSQQGLFLQAIITPFKEADTEGYLVILQDLTRIRRLETVRRDFISNISHELRTPLAGIKALVDTLRGGAIKDRPAAKRFLKRMDAEVDTLTQMVEELLELSRIESGRAPLRLVPTPVPDIVIPPVDRLRPQAERAGLELAVLLAPHLPQVAADAERARLVLTNLVHNAVKFTPPGGKVTVSTRSFEDEPSRIDSGGRPQDTVEKALDAMTSEHSTPDSKVQSGIREVVFSVEDTGVGIPTEDLPRVFERFYKADRARSGGGTGLGLAIAKHIVQDHGGRLWAESVEGRGSTFYFTLPVATEPG